MAGLATIVVVAIGLLVFLVPGAANSINSVLFNAQSCDQAPFAENCFCGGEEEKLPVETSVIPRYFCESVEKFIDPNDPDFDSKVKNYAQSVFLERFPDCDMFACDKGNAEWSVFWGYPGEFDKRIIAAECVEEVTDTSGRVYSQIAFNVDNGELDERLNLSCFSYVPLPDEFSEIAMHGPIDDRGRYGYVDYTGSVYSTCGTGVAEKRIEAWEYPLLGWELVQTPVGVDCEILSEAEDHSFIDLRCDTHCPHEDRLDIGRDLKVRMIVDEEAISGQCGRQGSLGKRVVSGDYFCERDYFEEVDTKIYRLNQCVDGRSTTLAEMLTACSAPFWGKSDVPVTEPQYSP